MIKKKPKYFYFAFLMIFFTLSSTPLSAKEEKESASLPRYTILDEIAVDTPLKTHITLDVLVSGDVSESGLRALLNKLYSSLTRRKFRYHTFPTNVYIYAYLSYKNYKSGKDQCIATLNKSYTDVEPAIKINVLQISKEEVGPEEKFGLSEEKRKEIWKEIVEIEDGSFEDAEKIYPLPDPTYYPNFITDKKLDKKLEYQTRIFEKYMNRLAREHDLTRDELQEIRYEGIRKNWSLP